MIHPSTTGGNTRSHDLEAVAEELFTHRCRGVEVAEQCSEIAVPNCRNFTDEEIDAVRASLNMHKSTASSIVRFMGRLSEQALSSIVVRRRSVVAEPPAPIEKKTQFILARDRTWLSKRNALQFSTGLKRNMAWGKWNQCGE